METIDLSKMFTKEEIDALIAMGKEGRGSKTHEWWNSLSPEEKDRRNKERLAKTRNFPR